MERRKKIRLKEYEIRNPMYPLGYIWAKKGGVEKVNHIFFYQLFRFNIAEQTIIFRPTRRHPLKFL